MNSPSAAHDPEQARLIQALADAEAALQAHVKGGIDSIIRPDGRPLLLSSAQQQLIRSEAVQREAAALQSAIVDALPGNLALLDQTGRIISTNAAWRAFGREECGNQESDFIGLNYLEVCDQAEGDGARDAKICARGIRDVLAGTRSQFTHEYPCHRPDHPRWFRAVVTPISSDQITGVIVIHFDVTERVSNDRELARVNRALRLLTKSNNTISQSKSEETLLADTCRLAHEIGNYPLAWIGYALDDPDRTIEPRARAGETALDLNALRISWSAELPTGRGPAGLTIRTGETHVVKNLERAPMMTPWFDIIRREGYHSLVCLPLKSPDRTFGVFIVYLDNPDPIPPEELALLKELAEDLSFGILAQRTRATQARNQAALLKTARGVSGIASKDFFATLIENLVGALDSAVGFIARVSPQDPTQFEPLAALREGKPVTAFAVPASCTPDLMSDAPIQWWREPFSASPPHAGSPQPVHAGVVLRGLTGQALGLLVSGFGKEPTDPAFVESTLQIFAARASAELQRQVIDSHTRRQARLIDEAHDAFIVRDLDGCVREWSRAAEHIYGWTAAEAIGQPAIALLQPEPDTFAHAARQVLQHDYWNGEIQMRTKSGDSCIVAARWTLLRDDQGKPEGVLSIDSNITDQKNTELQLLRAQRVESIGTLAGGIAHDMNNMLAPIVMGIELLKPAVSTDSARRVIANMERNAKRGAGLVRQILSFARGVEGSRVSLHPQAIIREIEALIENTFPKNIAFNTHVDPDLHLVVGDPTQLNQVLVNLCVNARDAMPGGGTLGIKAHNVLTTPPPDAFGRVVGEGSFVCITISDTGCGIPADVLERIFEPFFTTKPTGEGTGLGLATTLGIVRSHEGFFLVESQPGAGTTFRVHLPARPNLIAPEAAERTAAMPRGEGQGILVVDDEPDILAVVRETLEASGFHVITAAEGTAALALYHDRAPDIALVITDLMMPVMDGTDLILALRKQTPNLPIIASSGLNAHAHVERVRQLDNIHFLPKPFDIRELLQLVDQSLHPYGD